MKKKKSNSNDDIVSFVPGANIIDIGALKAEMEADPELQKDVLADFEESDSDFSLDQIATAIETEEQKQLEDVTRMVSEVEQEFNAGLEAMNTEQISEDVQIETSLQTEANANADVIVEDATEKDLEFLAALPQQNQDGHYDVADLQSCIEALLFYSDRSISLKRLKEMMEMVDTDDQPILAAIEALKKIYAEPHHGFEVAEIAGGYQLRTKASRAPLLRKLAKVQVQRLSRGAMETLTIVAYKQPCTKDDIDQIRGVDSSHFIRTLLDRKLIDITGRAESAGRPMVYATTDTFLEVFGLMDLKSLPPLKEIEAMVPQLAAAEEGAEDPRVVQMRKMVQQMKTESNALDYSAKEDESLLKEIRDRVKAIDVTSPYLERQKELAAQGIHGEEAEAILAKEMGFDLPSTKSDEQMSLSDLQSDLPLQNQQANTAAATDETPDHDFDPQSS